MKKIFLLLFWLSFALTTKAQTLYFPPTDNNQAWQTTDPATLGWCPARIDNLYNYLEQQNTKGFMILKDGKIVLERYFGTFTQDSLWYWASAGKTITSFLVGKAQEENLLNLTDKTSDYLGTGWTSCTLAQENNITIRHQLTMTTGLDDGVTDNHCTTPACLNYLANAGTRWAYHNAPYTLLESVLENATGVNINLYTQQKLKTPTGMTGLWTTVDYDNVYFSRVRSMARFGLLIQGGGAWNGTQLINPTYYNQMINTSQNLNLSYGYLWWLNGKSSFMVPTSQIVFPGSYAPDAPADMYAAIGKNGQILSIAPSQGLVVVRMGNASNDLEVPFLLCNEIWQRINLLDCNLALQNPEQAQPSLYPNPAQNELNITHLAADAHIEIYSALGQKILTTTASTIDVSGLARGLYCVKIHQNGQTTRLKWIKE
ncbi:serine hydrolase [Flavobacterium sp. CYK-55]|uniref:serine hydrolase n=1 Tax=Flavobacterium sp. CYK-55 TaxID=2835529 RepID=UPI001BCAA9E7|nr:serine hydrolase [Flavobacterium sp. CYK-55]MBS7787084.1 serine hydrolase [Flavobacterium sp. CYK-55]